MRQIRCHGRGNKARGSAILVMLLCSIAYDDSYRQPESAVKYITAV
jgi:hypothetical protein